MFAFLVGPNGCAGLLIVLVGSYNSSLCVCFDLI